MSNSSRKERPPESFRPILRTHQPTSEGADLLHSFRVHCMGLDMLSIRDDNLATIRLSLTTYTGSRGDPEMELALRISRFILPLSPVEMLMPQHITP